MASTVASSMSGFAHPSMGGGVAPGAGQPGNPQGGGGPPTTTESQARIDALSSCLTSISSSTRESQRCCDALTRRARHLESLTSPASDASALLTQASENLATTLGLMREAREKFDTVADCEPAILRLARGSRELVAADARAHGRGGGGGKNKSAVDAFMPSRGGTNPFSEDGGGGGNGGALSEQDVYAAADSMEILRDAYEYFVPRTNWKSVPSTLQGLERVHQSGVDAMCLLIAAHMTSAGPAVRRKKDSEMQQHGGTGSGAGGKGRRGGGKLEQAHETRKRLTEALQNRDLMKAVGEYQDFLPLETRPVRELRAMMECLSGAEGGAGSYLGPPQKRPRLPPPPESGKIIRTEKVGSGSYSAATKKPLKTSFPQLDAYGEARKSIAYASIDGYYRFLKNEQKKRLMSRRGSLSSASPSGGRDGAEVDAAARDAVRCLEHAMVVVAGEKSVFRCVISPSSSHTYDDSMVSSDYKQALMRSYSHVVSGVVDRTMDIIELVFFKDLGIGQASASSASSSSPNSTQVNVRMAASAAAAGLRILDGVRILGPSLAKLCDLSESRSSGGADSSSLAASLCISIHRTTVKNCARTLENLVKAIQNNPLDGELDRPPDCRVAPVSSDVVRAIRIISPFVSAYKSVTKRRALPWDQKIGEDASDMDTFIKYLVGRLLSSLQGKAGKYMDDQDQAATAKAPLFMINNTFYLLEQLGKEHSQRQLVAEDSGNTFALDTPWFKQKVGSLFQGQKEIYLAHWETLNKHLTSVDKSDLNYQNEKLLSLESGRLLKSRFSGFSEDFETIYTLHKPLTVIDPKLRDMMQGDVRNVFLPRYKRFFSKYSRIQFSKKNQDQYLKYPPAKVDAMLNELYETL